VRERRHPGRPRDVGTSRQSLLNRAIGGLVSEQGSGKIDGVDRSGGVSTRKLAGLLGLGLLTACTPHHEDSTGSTTQGLTASDRLSAPLTALTRASRQPLGFVVRDGVATALTGRIDVTGTTPLERTRAFLARYPTLYSDTSLDLPVRHVGAQVINKIPFDHVVLYQRLGGIEVYGAELAFLLSGTTVLSAGGWVMPDVPKLELRPGLNADDAERVARGLGGTGVLATTPRLFVYDRRAFQSVRDRRAAPIVLVWQVVVGGEQFLIDARDGALVRRDAHVEQLISTQIYDDFNNQNEVYDNGCLVASCSSTVTTIASSFTTAYNFYKNRFGWVGYDGNDNENEVYTNTSDQTAYYVNWIGDEYFKFQNSQVALDAIGHEFTHGVIDHHNGLDSSGEPGALNESFADLMGNAVESHLPSKVAEDSPGGAIRDMCDPASFGIARTMSFYIPDADNHYNSGIPSNAWCKTSQMLQGAGNSDATVRGKLADTAFSLFGSLPDDATFAITASFAMSVAQTMFGPIGSNPFGHACLVNDAWKAVGVNVSGPIATFCSSAAVDDDSDGIPNSSDNCRNLANPSQKDTDGDGIGDLCDPDIDGDGVANGVDNCNLPNADQKDANANGKGDACEDFDGDGVRDDLDNCIVDSNPSQLDTDHDGTGDACETNQDTDLIDDNNDNCLFVDNNNQLDSDGDGIGDACDPCPTTFNVVTAWTAGNPALGIKPKPILPDSDGDGTPDACDNAPFGGMKMNGGSASASAISPNTKTVVEGAVSADQPLLIPFEPCPRGGCVKYDEAMPLVLAVTGADRMRVSVIDDRGKVVGKLTRGAVKFEPRGGRTYRLAVTSKVAQSATLIITASGGER
jgi:Thermolysin metallopeptidase, alpha-helical domain/Thrombospondin type 3 repeat/Thermolysin metallopeptidase, catalytic domain